MRDHRSLAEREEKLERLEKQLDLVLKENKESELKIAELRQRVTSLQQELDTSEAVQKDFVRLSQSLQVRRSDTIAVLQDHSSVTHASSTVVNRYN